MLKEFLVLGCGTCVNDGRLPSGYAVQADSGLMLLDNGPGTIEKLPAAGYSATAARYVLLTHAHPDHVCLGYLLQTLLNTPGFVRSEPLTVLGPQDVMQYLRGILRIWPSLRPDSFELQTIELGPAQSYSTDDLDIYTFRTAHGRSALAYRIVADNAVLAYSGDTGLPDDERLVELGRNADLYVIECSLPPNLEAPSHLNAEQVAEILATAKPKRAALTHLYPPALEFGAEALAAFVSERSGCLVEVAEPLKRWQWPVG